MEYAAYINMFHFFQSSWTTKWPI